MTLAANLLDSPFDVSHSSVGASDRVSLHKSARPSNVHRATSGVGLAGTQIAGSLYADASRKAGRLNAASINKDKHEALLKERASLVQQKLEDGINRTQEARLAYVRWQLDRIEDARFGAYYDQVESLVERYEYFVKEIDHLKHQIDDITR